MKKGLDTMPSPSRRALLKQIGAFSAMGAAAPLGISLSAITQAAAQSASGDYRALVCVFLYGGNDAYNTVLATDATSWGHYLNHRNPRTRVPTDTGASIALMAAGTAADPSASANTPERLGGVLPISHVSRLAHAGRSFAFHPALGDLRNLQQGGRLAVLANVGPLVKPTLKTDLQTAGFPQPAKLYSHNDQQSTWMSLGVEGTETGWAGLMGDVLKSRNGVSAGANMALIQRAFTGMSPTGAAVWMNGRTVLPFQTGATSLSGLGSNGRIYGSAALQSAVVNIMSSAASTSHLTLDHQALVQRATQANALIGSQLPQPGVAPWGTAGEHNPYNDALLKYTSTQDGSQKTNPLALQLQMVARLIATNGAANLGIQRQFFLVGLGGFDNHDNLIANHGEGMAQLNHGLAYFDRVMQASGLGSQVTAFTASDFGRTFTNNGDGTDHGWGAHHLIMGGAVKGADVYGVFPTYSTANSQGVFSSPHQLQNGVMLPGTSVEQYAYTLGKWMGVSASDLLGILPNLQNFDVDTHDLGFMNA